MNIDSNDFRPREGKAIDLDKWPTIVPPLFESKAEYEAVLKQHVEGLSARQQVHYASARCASVRSQTQLRCDCLGVLSRTNLEFPATIDGNGH